VSNLARATRVAGDAARENPGMALIPIASQADAEKLLTAPRAWLMKHSSTCGISAAAYDEVRAYADAHPDEPIGVIVVQTHRPISNWLAQKLGAVHQSPQMFLVERGATRWQATHWSITAGAMEQAARG
jgi:bacillithiol system protein YtxJ